VIESSQRLFGLEQQLTLVGGKRHFGVALQARRTDVGLVVARAVDSITQQILQFAGRVIEFTAQALEVRHEFRTNLFLFGRGPWVFIGTDG